MIQGLLTLILVEVDYNSVPLSVQVIHLGIYHSSNKPTNVESGLDKI
jgi:hypothetical protein